jgi:hypothetical protein
MQGAHLEYLVPGLQALQGGRAAGLHGRHEDAHLVAARQSDAHRAFLLERDEARVRHRLLGPLQQRVVLVELPSAAVVVGGVRHCNHTPAVTLRFFLRKSGSLAVLVDKRGSRITNMTIYCSCQSDICLILFYIYVFI